MSARSALLACALTMSGPAVADVAVQIAPQRAASQFEFRDARERDRILAELARQITTLAERSLPNGVALDVTLLDVRPAGRIDPFVGGGASQIRVLTGATPPSVTLRYALRERGRRVASGEETVSDLNYLDDASARTSLASYPYERELIRDWFRSRIIRREAAR